MFFDDGFNRLGSDKRRIAAYNENIARIVPNLIFCRHNGIARTQELLLDDHDIEFAQSLPETELLEGARGHLTRLDADSAIPQVGQEMSDAVPGAGGFWSVG